MVVYGLQCPQARQLAWALLACAARRTWGVERLPELERGAHGKPFFSQLPQWCFNISHSGQIAVCALGEVPVGLDIQMHRGARDALLRQVCSQTQRRWLAQRGDSPQAFARLWSMKESRCKWSGEGLQRPISAISVPLPRGEERGLEENSLCYSLRSGGGWELALCANVPWEGEVQWLEEAEVRKYETFVGGRNDVWPKVDESLKNL